MEIRGAVERLRLWCETHGMNWDMNSSDRFCRYIELLLQYQVHTNLTGFDSADGLVDNMMIDSLQILRGGEIKAPVLDVGTGAGFPSLPMKIVRPDLEMILVEPRTKRYAFLRKVEYELGLTGLRIERQRIEDLHLGAGVGLAVSKAFRSFYDWFELASCWEYMGTDIGCFTTCTEWACYKDKILERGWRVLGSVQEGDRVYMILRK